MEYDYIVIGAGSAGCVLADRLSERRGLKVLVLEAGGSDARFWIKVPLGYGMTYADARLNWGYTAAPDPGLNGRAAYWPRGRVVGGSSSINAMAYVRGLPKDFDDWQATGAAGWNAAVAADTFGRIEQHGEAGRFRGTGRLRVSDLRGRMHPFARHFLKGARDLGWSTPEDMNAPGAEGLSYYRSTVRGGLRCSAADAFLRPALRRGNVTLIKNALVERLVFDGRRATGVRFRIGGQSRQAAARAEVIVSAGAVNSPQLLQVSGLGPADLLKSHGIAVRQDLPEVGRGMQDHLTITHHFEATEPTLNARLGSRPGQFAAGLQYLLTRRGPLSVPINAIGGFVRSGPDQPAPDMQIYCNPMSYSVREDGAPEVCRTPGFLLCAQPCRPTSRGEVVLASADPAAAPIIRPGSLSTNEDCEDAIRAGRVLQALARAPAIARVTKAPKGQDLASMSDADLLEDFRERANTNFHPTCTCRMGRDASTSVLDGRLRVHGMAGLRVVDASAFPNITSGNTNAPTIMLAMRAADLILEDLP